MSLKPVVIVLESLPPGLKCNFSAVLGMSLGQLRPTLIGPGTPTAEGLVLPGITTVPVPVLAAPASALQGLLMAAEGLPVRIVYMRAALDARDYADYAERVKEERLSDHVPLALLLAGPRKEVDRICGRLPLVR